MKIISTLDDAISFINTLYNTSSIPPTAGSEDYLVWTALCNLAVNTWEQEELWKELYVKLSDAPDGVKTTTPGTYSYACPSLINFPVNGYVWLGTGNNKTAWRVIDIKDKQLYENTSDKWCYFLLDSSPTLEFNPNYPLPSATINYDYYKYATKLTTGTDPFEMSDPMFAVYFVLAELKKEEGNAGELQMASQKLNGMIDQNEMPTSNQADQLINPTDTGFNT